MVKVYRYEMQRILCSRLLLIFAGAVLFFSYVYIDSSLLYGVYDTAPYSQWSFLSYLAVLSPLLMAIPLYYVAQIQSAHEKGVRVITGALPVRASWYMAVKSLAVITAFVLCAALAVGMVFIFYGAIFSFQGFGELIGLALLFYVPLLLFCYGAGMWLGRVSPLLVYGLLAVLIFAGYMGVPMPMAADVLGTSLLRMGDGGLLVQGEIVFSIPPLYLLSRTLIAALGVALTALACLREDGKK